MIDQPRQGAEHSAQDQAPELHNSEQEDEQEQSQTLAEEGLRGEARRASPLDSIKVDNPGDLVDDSTQDLVDHMRDMEQSGRIDMGAYLGEPNHDDNEDKYGIASKLDDLPSDGGLDMADEDELESAADAILTAAGDEALVDEDEIEEADDDIEDLAEDR